MDDRDPPRIGEPGGPGSERLAALLKQARADVGSDAEVNALRAALGPAIWQGGGPGNAAKTGLGAGAKLGIGAAIVAGAVAAWLATRSSPTMPVVASATPTETPAPTPPAEVPPRPEEAPAPPTEVPRAPDEAPPPPAEIPHPPAETPSEPAKKATSKPATSEAELLGRAQAAVGSNPSLALALCAEHRASFPRGMMVQEREVIAIEALSRSGRSSEAAARAARFRKSFPNSAYQSKIDNLVPR